MRNRHLTFILAAIVFALVFVGLMSALRSAQAQELSSRIQAILFYYDGVCVPSSGKEGTNAQEADIYKVDRELKRLGKRAWCAKARKELEAAGVVQTRTKIEDLADSAALLLVAQRRCHLKYVPQVNVKLNEFSSQHVFLLNDKMVELDKRINEMGAEAEEEFCKEANDYLNDMLAYEWTQGWGGADAKIPNPQSDRNPGGEPRPDDPNSMGFTPYSVPGHIGDIYKGK
jgi:hypothetical protein